MQFTQEKKDEINNFIKIQQEIGSSRVGIDKMLKRMYNVRFANRRYTKHTGLKQKIRNLMKQGNTREEALELLDTDIFSCKEM